MISHFRLLESIGLAKDVAREQKKPGSITVIQITTTKKAAQRWLKQLLGMGGARPP